MSQLRDILDLPTEVKKSDFVIRLTEGIGDPDKLVASYAMTGELVNAYDKALTLAGAALRDKQSVASYVHGSFGSGKSHFLAILSLMLGNHPAPWTEPKLHVLRDKHGWIRDKKLLRLHFHMIGARSLEERIFGEYLRYVDNEHPDAPVPPLFEDQGLFDNAEALRGSLGDEKFFSAMNAAQPAAKGWGKLGAAGAWDRASWDRARSASEPDERSRLFSVLVKSHFPAFARSSGGYIGFDEGLAVLSRHAAQLGFDGVVLFLDELVLWLASRAADRAWLNSEGPKLAKLVEAQDDRRAIPIVSFVARQRDVVDLVGDQYAGPEAQNLRDAVKWWEGRFDVIRLEDKILPAVIEKRVVRAKDPAAKKRLEDAFGELRRTLGTQEWGTLLGDLGDETAFRQVYPFSPALVEALVALSHYLQRERTALKVLMELLVGHLEDFQLGQLVPVGDLFDALAGGEEPMDGAMRDRFDRAKRLYHDELLPLLQSQNDTGTKEKCQRRREEHPVELGCANCPETRCRTDNRLVKTLLLAALVPGASVLKNLTVSRLVQLNHGTLRTKVPGGEVAQAAKRVRSWAAEAGTRVRAGDQVDPTVQIALEGVDIRPVIDAARYFESPGAKRRKLQEILFAALGLDTVDVTIPHKLDWRGCSRVGVIHYGNVREMDDATLAAGAEHDFKIVVDYPFDDPNRTPREDEARVARYLDESRPSPTIVWLPSFFGERVQRDLADLCIIDKLREGDTLRSHMPNARPEDVKFAEIELESLAGQKRERVRQALEAAYGLPGKPEEGALDPARSVDRHFTVLTPGLTLRGVASATLGDALRDIVHQLLEERFPRHPTFADRVTRAKLDKILGRLPQICESDGERMPVGRSERQELVLGENAEILTLTETSAALRRQRFDDVERALRTEGADSPSVSIVRRLFDPSEVMGLTREVSDFLVLAYAIASDRELQRGDQPLREVTLGKLPDDARLVRPELPEASAWQRALDRAAAVLAVTTSGRARHVRNLRAFVEKVQAKRREMEVQGAHRIAELLVRRAGFFEGEPPRLVTARKVSELWERLHATSPIELVETVSTFEPLTSEKAMLHHLTHARRTAEALEDALVFESLGALEGRSEPEAAVILAAARRVLEADQINEDLPPALRDLALQAQKLLRGGSSEGGEEVVVQGGGSGIGELETDMERMRELLERDGSGSRLTYRWQITRRRT
jgi:hypothetical protein